jgi:hypothetical protein
MSPTAAASMLRAASPTVAARRDRHAGDAVPVTGPRRLVPGQAGQAEDEEQGGDDVGRGGGGDGGHVSSS